MKLTIELVPSTCWYSNVRSNVSKAEWDIIRKESYSNANNCCEICKSTGKQQGYNHNVECHEIWEYDDINLIQKLTGLISLCPLCHKTKHIGLAELNGEYKLVLKHFCNINNVSIIEAEKYIKECFKLWNKRSQYDWKLDISYLDKYKPQELF